jgi:hypothetical protein
LGAGSLQGENMKITIGDIRNAILNDKFSLFVEQFPVLLGYFSAFKKKPNCEGCLSKVLSELAKEHDYEEKLKNIFGKDVVIDEEILTYTTIQPSLTSQMTEVFEIEKADYGNFMETFCKDKLIRNLNTIYIPETQSIVVTIVYNIMVKNV